MSTLPLRAEPLPQTESGSDASGLLHASEPSDGALVRAARRGDTDAFGILVSRYREKFARYAASTCGDGDLAADAMQEALIRAWDKLDTCRNPDRFGAWFFRILTNQCHNHRDRRRRHLALEHVTVRARGRTDEAARMADARRVLSEALDALGEDQRVAFTLRHMEDLSYREMAGLLDEREDALRQRVKRAREAVFDRLKELQ